MSSIKSDTSIELKADSGSNFAFKVLEDKYSKEKIKSESGINMGTIWWKDIMTLGSLLIPSDIDMKTEQGFTDNILSSVNFDSDCDKKDWYKKWDEKKWPGLTPLVDLLVSNNLSDKIGTEENLLKYFEKTIQSWARGVLRWVLIFYKDSIRTEISIVLILAL